MQPETVKVAGPPDDVELEKNQAQVLHCDDVETTLTAAQQRKIIRRIDIRLLPILGCMYSISLMDRGNMALALVAGMREDLALNVGDRYTYLVMIFFAAYIVFELPSNLVLPKLGPQIWLTFLGLSFGAISIGMGFTKHWGELLACRILLGIFEAGFLPGCSFLISCWYTRYEVGKRLAAFWIISVCAAGFAGILAYAFTQMDGLGGVAGWRWIMIIEGAITCVICIAGYFILIDFPDKADGFLKIDEKAWVMDRINADRGDAVKDPITVKVVLNHLKDWKLYGWWFFTLASTMPGFAYSYYLPLILRQGMGFSTAKAQLLTAPPYIFAAILCMISSTIGDKYRIRGPIIIVHEVMTIVGVFITAYCKGNGVRYFGVFIGLGFVQYCPMAILTFQANNITSTSKRAVGSATCIIGAGMGGMLAGGAYKNSEAPLYQTGIFLSLALCIVSITGVTIMDLYFWRCNKLARQGKRVNEGMPGWFYTY